MKHWTVIAKERGHICPKCSRLVAEKYWKATVKRGHCWFCHIGNWSDSGYGKIGVGGSSQWDNREFEDEMVPQ